ncbi:MAG: hypothetical protein ACRDQG_04670 [Pseudonocardiaceae bacterium]
MTAILDPSVPTGWLGDPGLRAAVLDRLAAHRAAGTLRPGVYQAPDPAPTGYSGCALGCCLPPLPDTPRPDEFWTRRIEHDYGIPQPVAQLIERLFERHDPGAAPGFATRAIAAVPVGADLSHVTDLVLYDILCDCPPGLGTLAEHRGLRNAAGAVAVLYLRRLAGRIPDADDWQRATRLAQDTADAAPLDQPQLRHAALTARDAATESLTWADLHTLLAHWFGAHPGQVALGWLADRLMTRIQQTRPRAWSEHTTEIGDWCPWSGTPATRYDRTHPDPGCPALCPDSQLADPVMSANPHPPAPPTPTRTAPSAVRGSTPHQGTPGPTSEITPGSVLQARSLTGTAGCERTRQAADKLGPPTGRELHQLIGRALEQHAVIAASLSISPPAPGDRPEWIPPGPDMHYLEQCTDVPLRIGHDGAWVVGPVVPDEPLDGYEHGALLLICHQCLRRISPGPVHVDEWGRQDCADRHHGPHPLTITHRKEQNR